MIAFGGYRFGSGNNIGGTGTTVRANTGRSAIGRAVRVGGYVIGNFTIARGSGSPGRKKSSLKAGI